MGKAEDLLEQAGIKPCENAVIHYGNGASERCECEKCTVYDYALWAIEDGETEECSVEHNASDRGYNIGVRLLRGDPVDGIA